ncbi:deoxyguanosinetriphosphate triphosphohydrolase [Oscillospiraceae bacterium MB08-C2-2]|nr:deoxyguanosinetriphosphate triphosphohydrolase [Oscillospiraceae bacterium MB08-C2-2]
MTVRQQTEAIEAQTLRPTAAFSAQTRGREIPDAPCPIRTEYQRDRDRITHCKSFRRLMNKTQVFLSPEGDHYRTRLTHTLEVTQIARTVARALRLNEDLVEAIALGHDLGHTPFGHAGEEALGQVCPHGYRHSVQSVRVVEVLENEGRGLNLTWEVRNGIACHSSGYEAETLEGRVVRYADKIAYMNHDIDDAIRAGVLRDEDIPWDVRYVVGRTRSQRITAFVTALIENSGDDKIAMDAVHQQAYDNLRAFLFQAVYTNPEAKSEEGKAKGIVRQLYQYFVEHSDQLPPEYRTILEKEGVHRGVCDYISGMSDRYCVTLYEKLFIPRSWSI